ncbi:MAG: hypothetical protein A2X34_02550 [Elusimicrobia bacterium GWC2_51_8]|nr:MAG: hypothetical protein A2X33_00925 [Elusimicrobia bacterium GWA2_51_34]OGR60184.1 MAG: hypothetical protein A2X34_02550 [Elusimicrobia bacterium GWC2_51_8]HAF94816.1 hypothetical protein [Elusimicrobiota bacterium]HCE98874.1 hypothetical protein [Elusimicrobiota bacterium]
MKTKKPLHSSVSPKAPLAAVLLFSGLFFAFPAADLFAGAFYDLTAAAFNLEIPAIPNPAPAKLLGPLKAAPALNAYFVKVGQGDCEYLELPNGKNVLIDGGPADYSGTGIPPVARFLTQQGITRLDHVVLTHPHADHFAGLQYVFDHVQVDNFYDTREDNPGASTLKALRKQISQNPAVTVNYPAEGDTLNWDPGEVQVKVLNSCSTPGQSTSGGVLNNCSIVLKVTYQDISLLYGGDMQDELEARLVSKYGSALQADVLKVGHHGSANASSTSYLGKVKPKFAYIEVGAGNPFGHPTQAALSRLQATGAKIYRTDLDGTQKFTVSGGNSTLEAVIDDAYAQPPETTNSNMEVFVPPVLLAGSRDIWLVDITETCTSEGEVVSAYPAVYKMIVSEENSRILKVFRFTDLEGIERRIEVYFTGGDWMKYGLTYFVTNVGADKGRAYFINDLSTADRENGRIAPRIDPFDSKKLADFIAADFLDSNGSVKAVFSGLAAGQ